MRYDSGMKLPARSQGLLVYGMAAYLAYGGARQLLSAWQMVAAHRAEQRAADTPPPPPVPLHPNPAPPDAEPPAQAHDDGSAGPPTAG